MEQRAYGPARLFYLGLALVTMATLALEIIQTRMLSVVTWYHLAFFVISMAMFGMTLGALRVFLSPNSNGMDTVGRSLPRAALFTALAIGICYLDQICLAPETVMSASTVVVFARLALTIAVPFYFSGLCVTFALTRTPYPVGVTYGADLVGAAAGCLLVLPLLSLLDGPGAIYATASITALGAWCFALWGNQRKLGRYALLVTLLMAVIAAWNANTIYGLDPIIVKGQAEKRHWVVLEKWNSFSRVLAYREMPYDAKWIMWSAAPNMPSTHVVAHEVNIDGGAGTRLFKWDAASGAMDFLLWDATAMVYAMRQGSVAIIGLGGGKDVMTALAAGNRQVLGVDINSVFLDMHKGPFRDYTKLADRPDVRMVNDEARSFFTRDPGRYDIIQASLIDTWAATGAGAFSLSENSLYTVEAWKIFLDHLSDNGVFTVSRWHAANRLDESARLVSLALASLMQIGIADPSQHLLLGASDTVATILVAKTPFNTEDVDKFKGYLARTGFKMLMAPGEPPLMPIMAALAQAPNLAGLEKIAGAYPLDISPPTDSRPFFFNLLRLSRPWEIASYWGRPSGVVTGNLVATVTLLVVFLIALIFAAGILILPYKFAPAGALLPRPPELAWFALIGLGFMFTEIAFMQRLSVFLGHPVYALAVVLFSLILFTGLGSFASEKIRLTTTARLIAYALVLAAYLAVAGWWMPQITIAFQGLALGGRVGICLLILGPAGLLMGQAFPAGMRLARRPGADPTPWLWGVNGAAGVLASVLAVMISIAYGITATMMLGAACYAALVVVALRLRPGGRS